MKQIVIGLVSGIATAAVLFVSAPANASETPSTIESWVKATNQKLESRMVYPPNGESGVVVATFERGQDGSPTAIDIRPASPALVKAAKITLGRVHDLPPLPAGYSTKRIRFQMLVGDPSNITQYQAQRSHLLASAQASNVQLVRSGSVQVASNRAR